MPDKEGKSSLMISWSGRKCLTEREYPAGRILLKKKHCNILKSGETTPLFADGIAIDGSIASKVRGTITTNEGGWTTVTTVYEYDGVTFMLEAEVDAVQTHNAERAMKSAWGVDAAVGADGTLTLR